MALASSVLTVRENGSGRSRQIIQLTKCWDATLKTMASDGGPSKALQASQFSRSVQQLSLKPSKERKNTHSEDRHLISQESFSGVSHVCQEDLGLMENAAVLSLLLQSYFCFHCGEGMQPRSDMSALSGHLVTISL